MSNTNIQNLRVKAAAAKADEQAMFIEASQLAEMSFTFTLPPIRGASPG